MNKHKNKLLIAGIILVACVLRTPLTGVGSLISQIRTELDLSHFLSGMITTIPLIAFAAVSPFVGKLSGTFGAGKTLTLSLFVLTAGIVLRSMGGSAGFLRAPLSSVSASPSETFCCRVSLNRHSLIRSDS